MNTLALNREDSGFFSSILISVLMAPIFILKCILGVLFLNWKISFRLFLVISFLSTIALFGYFIYQVNAEITDHYNFKKYSSEFNNLIEENQKLEMGLIEANSLNSVSESDLIEKLNFEKINKVSYIKVLSGEVVKK